MDSQIFLKMKRQYLELLYRDGEQLPSKTKNVQQMASDLLLIQHAVVLSTTIKCIVNAQKNHLQAFNIQFATNSINGLKIIVWSYGKIALIKATE